MDTASPGPIETSIHDKVSSQSHPYHYLLQTIRGNTDIMHRCEPKVEIMEKHVGLADKIVAIVIMTENLDFSVQIVSDAFKEKVSFIKSSLLKTLEFIFLRLPCSDTAWYTLFSPKNLLKDCTPCL
ncbi:hypothetical protein C0989_004392 [Termitomyces sp. Mn162]|nr:hypothetical protein C0989_004392 [Termitomyces sp. Mn162]